MKINRNYKYFVVDTCDWLVVSGWEYKEDALENLDDLLEGMSTAVTGDYKIYTARYLNSKDINPFNSDNWITNDYFDKKDNDYDCGVCEDTPKKYNNPDYNYYVVNTKKYKIHSGWEYKNDAQDQLNKLSDDGETMYSVYSAKHIEYNCFYLDADNNDHWLGNEKDCPDCETKQYKVTMEEVKYCYYIVNAKSEDDIRDNMNPEIDGEHIYTKPKSDEIIDVELYDNESEVK